MRRRIFLIATMLFLFSTTIAYADKYHAEIKHAEITRQQDEYKLAADFNYHLSPQALDALQNGVPLFWTVKIKVQQGRDFWFNKTVLKTGLRYRLQYHALLKMYRVKNENTDVMNNFSTLAAALNEMAVVRDLPLLTTNFLTINEQYLVAIKVAFEEDELPLPLQTQVLANSQWQLSSDWTLWEMPKFAAQN